MTGGCGGASDRSPSDSAKPAAPEAEPASAFAVASDAEEATSRRRPNVEREPFLGVVVPRETVEVSADLSGRLDAVEVRVGERVEAEQPLARIDVEPLRQELSAAEASLGAARAEIERREIELSEAERRRQRRERVPESFSREELEASVLEHETALAAHEGAKARLAEQRARVERLRELLRSAVLRAPFRGTVALRYLDPGATVAPGTPVVRLIAADQLFVRFAVPAERASEIEEGSRVEIAIEGVENQVTATVDQVAPEIDTASGMVFLEARLDEVPTGSIRSGVAARVSLPPAPTA